VNSFSADVKEELSKEWSSARHCQIAELAALLGFCGTISYGSDGHIGLKIVTENLPVARKVFTLIKKTFNIVSEISIKKNHRRRSLSYLVVVYRQEEILRILRATKLIRGLAHHVYEDGLVNPLVVRQRCCRRAFLRGSFLAAGSMSDPDKAYHFEIVCASLPIANQIKEMMCSFGMDAKMINRKKSFVVYLKESAQIVDSLNIMEAHVALMNLENIRILKDMRNTVNRKVNCETANIHKTVSAAVRQVEDIMYLRETVGLETLPETLEEIAQVRLSYPDATLKELGDYLTPQVGKSGVNHRLRKLSEIAEQTRQKFDSTSP